MCLLCSNKVFSSIETILDEMRRGRGVMVGLRLSERRAGELKHGQMLGGLILKSVL